MRKKSTIAVSIFLTITLAAIFIFQNTNTDIIDEGIVLSGTYKLDRESIQVIEDIEMMEEVLSEYFGPNQVEKVNQATLAFLRKDRYGYNLKSLTKYIWSTYAGALESEVRLSSDENKELFAEMEKIVEGLGNFKGPKINGINQAIDFIHMVVVTDMELTKVSEVEYQDAYYDYLFSWGGDLETFMEDVAKHFEGNNPSNEEIYDYAYELLGSNQSHFSGEDLLADVDGVNLAIMMEDGMLFSTALRNYYEGGMFLNRYDLFIESFDDGEVDKTNEERFSEVVEAVALGKMEPDHMDKSDAIDFYEEFNSLKNLMQMYVFDTDTVISDEIRETTVKVFLDKITQK